jgi:NhaA family Na+:H+ antiporter
VQLPLQKYLHTEGVGGAVLVAAAAAGVIWANSPWAAGYEALWLTEIHVTLGPWDFEHDLRHLVNDGLMAVFFFVVGLEIKRELIEGALSDRRRVMLPVVAALGGMVVPAALYALIVAGGPGTSGWGIPMATDIAFAIAVLALTAATHDLKVLLLAIAIVDDIGAILVIAVFYTADFSAAAAGVALGCVGAVLLMQRVGFTHMGFYVPVAALFWIAVLESGVHATIAGVVLGALTPARALLSRQDLVHAVRVLDERLSAVEPNEERNADRPEETEMLLAEVEELARQSESPLDRAERLFHPWSSYVILPLFALANGGIALTADAMRAAVDSPVAWAIAVGLVVGKPLGITAFSWIAVRAGIASLPEGMNWRHLAGVGLLGGIGFTVSLFITDLAFDDAGLIATAKAGIFAASLVAATGGWLAMRRE